jgi:hypothetical protein
MSHRYFDVPPAEHRESRLSAPDSCEEDEEVYNPISYERDVYPRRSAWPDESWPPRLPPRSGMPRWLIPCAVALAATVASVTLILTGGGGHAAVPRAPRTLPAQAPATPATPAAAQPALTMAQAQRVLNDYTATNNAANSRMSTVLLGTIETGSSYAIDAGAYREQVAAKAPATPAFAPEQAELFIPRLVPGAYPSWFVAQVANANLASPGHVTNMEYLLFTQAAPGAPWKNTIEPYMLSGSGMPMIATNADGYATAVPADTTGLSAAPGQIAAITAKSLDGGGPVRNPGNLEDLSDQAFWRGRLPTKGADTDTHAPGPDGVFGLRTLDGGALLFYSVSAEVRLAPPPGETMHLSIPGFYSSAETLRSADVDYLEQFATYVPALGDSGLRVVADYSGITARS